MGGVSEAPGCRCEASKLGYSLLAEWPVYRAETRSILVCWQMEGMSHDKVMRYAVD